MPALHAAGFTIVVLSRIGFTVTFPCYVEVRCVDDFSIFSFITALTRINAVAASLAAVVWDLDTNLIEAAVAAGVKYFIPGHYTADIQNEKSRVEYCIV